MAAGRYDAIFVGKGLISLTAAAALSKRGKSVLLLDKPCHNPPGGFEYSLGPALYFGYEKWGAMEGCLAQLAYPLPGLQDKGFLFENIAPLFQVILPSRRINLYAGEESYASELNREFEQQAHKLKTLFNQISREATFYYPYIGQFQQVELEGVAERINEWKKSLDFAHAIHEQQKRKALELLHPFSFSPDLLTYFNLLSLFSFKKPLREISGFAFVRLISSLQKGGVRMRGGYSTLVTFFQNLVHQWGGTSLEKHTISKLDIHKKYVTGIHLSDGRFFQSNTFVIAQESNRRTLNFYFTISHALIPPPMKDSLLMSWGGEAPKETEDLLVIRLNQPEGEPASNPDLRLIAVSVLLREGVGLSPEAHQLIQERVLERLYWLLPFSQNRIKLVKATPTLNPGTDEDLFFPYGQSGVKRKEVLKGVFSYSIPKGIKNAYVVDSDRSDYLCWGSDFLAGHRLAHLIDEAS